MLFGATPRFVRSLASAVAQLSLEAGVKLVTHVPGYGASQTFAQFPGQMSSYHEEVAYGMAVGAALAGYPSLCLIKMHGLLKAANAVVCSLSAGVSAGCLTVVFDDPSGSHSDNQLPTVEMLTALEIPTLVAHQPEQVPAALGQAWLASQRTGLPHVLVVDSSWMERPFESDLPHFELDSRPFQSDRAGQLVCPLLGDYQRQRLLGRLGREHRAISARLPQIDELPGSWKSQLALYRPWMKQALNSGRPTLVAGDTGLSSLLGLEPLGWVDTIGWMGGSLPLALGALAAGAHSAWAVTGDFSFLAAGHLGWLEALRRQLPLRVLLFDNGRAQATGGQPVDSQLLDQLLVGPGCQEITRPEDFCLDIDQAGPLLYRFRLNQEG